MSSALPPASKRTDLAPISFPKLHPEVTIDDYLQSKFEEEVIKRHPEWDLPRFTPITELITVQRQLHWADEKLAKKRAEHKIRRDELDGQWADLANKEELLKESFKKFDKFVRENQEKRDRAERKINDEHSLQEKRKAKIAELEESVEKLRNVKTTMEQQCQSYKIYEDYLQGVIKLSPDFKSTNDILNRYESLSSARKELAMRQERDLEVLEKTRTEMIRLSEEKMQEILGLNNQLASLRSRYEHARSKAKKWEQTVSKVKDLAAAKTRELGQVKTSCWILYTQLCKRKELEPTANPDDIEQQLALIKRVILELKKVVKIASKRGVKEVSSIRAIDSHGTGSSKK